MEKIQEKTILWHGNTVLVSRWEEEKVQKVEVLLQVGFDRVEFYGQGPNEAIALSDLEWQIRSCARGQYHEEVYRYYAQYGREPFTLEIEMADVLQKNAKEWLKIHDESRGQVVSEV